MKGRRSDRLNSEFRKEIYEIIKNKLNNPLITEMFTITEVDVSPDIKHAKVFIGFFSKNKERKDATLKAIIDSSSQIRFELGKVMKMRTVPELRFVTDTAFEYDNKIDTIISTFTYNTPENEEDE